MLFCAERKIDPLRANISDGLDFLTSALSAILRTKETVNYTFGENPDVKRFMKGIFENRPPKPRYNKIWDVNTVLQFMRNMNDSKDLPLKDLTLKLVMLIALTTASRGQLLHLLDLQEWLKKITALRLWLKVSLPVPLVIAYS